jgi:hypothetical protein
MQSESALHRFVRGMLGGAVGGRDGATFVLPDGRRAPAAGVIALVASGALSGDARSCRANSETGPWLKRSRLDGNAFAAQHRIAEAGPEGTVVNLAESPLGRLTVGDDPFLAPHQAAAGERVRKLVERAQLQPRMTMSYSAARTAGNPQQTVGDISDLAVDARRALADLHSVLPRDCAGVVMDVCGMLKGLQVVERERNWPRRSAKLVLRIALEQLAQHYGLGPFAVGRESGRPHRWIGDGAVPTRFD